MPIVRPADERALTAPACCTVCQQMIEVQDATAGGYDTTGRIIFACAAHTAHDQRWLRTWALHFLDLQNPLDNQAQGARARHNT